MKKYLVFLAVLNFALAGWCWWPFGGSEKSEPRLSELMEAASLLIDEASDLASDGKVNEAVEKYRAALEELDRVERENPDRVEKPEFATLKTKRAYVNAAIDSMLLTQVRDNARAVAVSDTTELEKKLAAEKAAKAKALEKEKPEESGEAIEGDEGSPKDAVEPAPGARRQKKSKAKGRRMTKRERALKAIADGDLETASILVEDMLTEKPNGAAALNIRAAIEIARGKFSDAESTLDQAIFSNPRDYFAYYNMALLYLRTQPEKKASAKRYYETGRTIGGPVDDELEELLK